MVKEKKKDKYPKHTELKRLIQIGDLIQVQDKKKDNNYYYPLDSNYDSILECAVKTGFYSMVQVILENWKPKRPKIILKSLRIAVESHQYETMVFTYSS